MSSLQLRLLSSLVLLAGVAFAFWLGRWAVLALIAAVTAAMLAEWWRMVHAGEWPAMRILTASASYRCISPKRMLVGVPYIMLAGVCAVLVYLNWGALYLLWVLVCVWATDIGAYFVGRRIGGKKLMPNVSPGKTVSGAAGGLLAAVAGSLVFAFLSGVPVGTGGSLFGLMIASALISAVSQAGDLAESYAKRLYGLKDSSNLIPGHGGFLDRMDGVLAALPVAVLYLWIAL